MIEIGLVSYLGNHAVVGPMVKSGTLTRIFPLLIPEHLRGERALQPCLVYQRISTGRSGSFCGTDRLASADIQIDSYALSYLAVKQLAKALFNSLKDYTGPMGDTHVDKVFPPSVEFDLAEPDTGLFRVSQTYSIWFVE